MEHIDQFNGGGDTCTGRNQASYQAMNGHAGKYPSKAGGDSKSASSAYTNGNLRSQSYHDREGKLRSSFGSNGGAPNGECGGSEGSQLETSFSNIDTTDIGVPDLAAGSRSRTTLNGSTFVDNQSKTSAAVGCQGQVQSQGQSQDQGQGQGLAESGGSSSGRW
ncbi:hypothetical protein EGW08_000601, partial [Elysia chlorotica]